MPRFHAAVRKYEARQGEVVTVYEMAVIGERAAVQLWWRPLLPTTGLLVDVLGGLEYHEAAGSACTDPPCHLLGIPCQHDGSGLYFNDYILPRLKPGLYENEAAIRPQLEQLYRNRYGET